MKTAFAVAALGFGVFFMMATQPVSDSHSQKMKYQHHKAMKAECEVPSNDRVIPTRI